MRHPSASPTLNALAIVRPWALGILAAALWSLPAAAQDDLGGLGAAGPGEQIERSWALNVHVLSSAFTNITGDVSGTAIEGDDAQLNGWGVEAETLGDRFTFLVGFEERSFEEDVDFVEWYGGAKLNFEPLGARQEWSPYLIGTLRYSQDLEFPTDPPSASDDFFRWSAGGGVTYQVTDRFFVDARVVYESTFTDFDARMGRDLGLSGTVAMLGAGFNF